MKKHSTPFSPSSGRATGSFNDLHPKSKSLAVELSIGILLAGMVGQAGAQTWNPQVTGIWSAGANWTPGTPLSGVTTLLNFSGANAAYTATNDLGNPFIVNGITFGQRAANATTIASAALNTIELGGANPFIGIPLVGGVDPNSATNVGVGFTSTLTLNPASGKVTFGSSGKGMLSISGIISSPGAVTLDIVGNNNSANWSFVRLAGANTFTGTVNLNGGHLVVGNNAALGNAANALVYNSGWIGASTATTIANNVTLNNDMQVMGTGGLLTLTGVISGNRGLRLSGLTSGTTGLTLTGANDYSGETLITTAPVFGQATNGAVNNGTLTISGATGAITNTSGIVARSGGTVTLSDVTAFTGGAAGRVNDAAGVTLAGSILNVTSGTAANYNETMARLTLESGNNAVAVTATASGAAQASFSNLTRQNRATVLFRGTSLGSTPGVNVGTINFAAAPTGDLVGGGGAAASTTISILPYAIGETTPTGTGTTGNLVTVDGANNIRPLVTAEYQATMTGGTTTTDNVRLAASLDLANATLTERNALVMTTGTLSNSAGGALRLTSGTILTSGAATISSALDFGTREAVVFTPAAATISGAISGSNGLTKSGHGTLTLSGPNNYTGPTTINSGTISIAAAAGLGGSTEIQVGGANNGLSTVITRPGLTYTGAAPVALSQNITIHSGFFAPVATTAAGTLQLDGQLSGAGGLYISITAGNRVILTNNTNNYTGQTRIFGGDLVISNDAQLGNGGSVDIGSTSTNGMILNGNWITNRSVNVSFDSEVDTNGNNWTQNGAFTGSAPLNKAGLGIWNLNPTNANSTMTGGVGVLAGRLNVNGFLATSTNALTVSNGATLGGTGEIDRPIIMNTGSTLAAGSSPGTLLNSSRSAAAVTFSAGALIEFEINNATGVAGVNWDRLVASNSAISLPNALTVQLVGLDGTNTLGAVPNFNNASDHLWEFATAPSFSGTPFGGITFTIDDTQFAGNNALGGGTFSIVQIGSTGLGVQFTAVPEPGSLALMGGMLMALAGRRNRRV